MPLIPDLRRALFFFWLTFLFCAQPAWATGANLVSFKKAYPAAKGISCKTCHQNPVGRTDDLNDYGLALRKFKAPAKAASLKVEDYRALEAQGTFPPGLGADSAQKKSSWQLRQEEKSSLIAWLDRLGGDSAWAQTEKAEYVGSESCAACHGQISSDFKHATHSRISIPDNQVHGCEMCHGPASLHVAAGGGRGVGGLVNPSKDPSACFACHMEKKAEFRLPFHHPVLEGKMSCASCHEPHQEEIRPWTSTSMEGINEACFKCHKEQRGPFAWEHEALREGCTTCHKVHGSIHDKMLVARDNNLCLRCHTQVVFPTIGRQSHSGRLPQGTCFSAGCHTAVHGSNFDDHLRY